MEWFAPGAGGFRIPMRHTFCASKKYAKTGWGFARTASGIRLQPLGRAPQTPLFTRLSSVRSTMTGACNLALTSSMRTSYPSQRLNSHFSLISSHLLSGSNPLRWVLIRFKATELPSLPAAPAAVVKPIEQPLCCQQPPSGKRSGLRGETVR